jgi:hypothetical protein
MQIKLPENLMRLVLPGLFLTYIAATILAFLLHAQYFNDVLAKTFAEPAFPTQVAVNLPLLNRVALLISLDQENIAALTSSAVRKATSSAVMSVPPESSEPVSNVATGTPPLNTSTTSASVATTTRTATSTTTPSTSTPKALPRGRTP